MGEQDAKATSSRGFAVAVLGATGLVGDTMIRVLEERKFPVSELLPLASNRSLGKRVEFRGKHIPVIDVAGNPVEIVTTGRHDPCVGVRATPICEAMLAIVLMDHFLRHRGQNADVRSSTPVITGKGS